MRTLPCLGLALALIAPMPGCDSAMTDASLKPEVTGRGPREPDAPGKSPASGNVDLGEVRGGPLETRPQKEAGAAPKPAPSPDGKAH